MKTEKQKMQDGSLYNADDEELIQERLKAKEVLYKYNQTAPSDRKGQERIISGLLGGHGDNLRIVAPFYCDYGYNIHVGNNFLPTSAARFWTGRRFISETTYFSALTSTFIPRPTR